MGVLCAVCGARINKFDRRVQLIDTKPESWGDGHGTATVHVLGAAVLCGWACVEQWAEQKAREVVGV